ncbi:MAG: PEP/pyruvate-binding domain-containing protein [Nanobdellota archaeon]
MPLVSLNKLNDNHSKIVDNKAIALAKLSDKFNIPEGFVITSKVFDYVIGHNDLHRKILNLLSTLKNDEPEKTQEIANQIQKLIIESTIPEEVTSAITESYQALNVTEDDLLDSFIGEETYPLVELMSGPVNYIDSGVSMYNISSPDKLLEAILSSYGLHYSNKSLEKRLKNNLNDKGVSITIQKTIEPDISGKAYIKDNNLFIEIVFGYYADELSNSEDIYKFDYETLELLEIVKNEQNILASVKNQTITIEDMPQEYVSKAKIESPEELSAVIRKVFNEIEFDGFEFSIVDEKLYITAINNYEQENSDLFQIYEEELYSEQDSQEEIEECKSIFSAFKDQSKEENPYYNRETKTNYNLKTARHPLGYAVVECRLVIRNMLINIYRELFSEEPPTSLSKLLDRICEKKELVMVEELRKIDELTKRFTREGNPPNILETKYTLEKTQHFIDQFQE